MNAGLLRDRVTIQQPSFAPDGQGGSVTSWSTLATIWAQVVPVAVGEQLSEGAIGARQVYRVIVRYRGDLAATMRVLWTPYLGAAAKTLQVNGVQPHPDEPRTLLQLACAEMV